MRADPKAFRAKYRKMAARPARLLPRQRLPLLRRRHGRGRPVRRRAQRADLDPRRPPRRELRHLPQLRRPAGLRHQRLRRGLPRPVHLGPAAVRGLAGAGRLAEGAARGRRTPADRAVRALLPRRRSTSTARARTTTSRSTSTTPRGRSTPRCAPPGCSAGPTCSTGRRCCDDGVRRFDEDALGPPAEPLGADQGGRGRSRATWRRSPTTSASTAALFYDLRDVVGKSGFGIGSAGLPAYNLLVEGYSQALDNDVVLSMKQANIPAVSRFVDSGGRRLLLRERGAPDRRQPAGAAGPHRPAARPHHHRRRGLRGLGGVAVRGGPGLVRPDRARRHPRGGRPAGPGDGQDPLRLRRGQRAGPRRLPGGGGDRRRRWRVGGGSSRPG